MNQALIESLIKQCKGEGWSQYSPNYDLEKFAMLIVKECAKVVDDKLVFDHSMGPDEWASSTDILNHFGMK